MRSYEMCLYRSLDISMIESGAFRAYANGRMARILGEEYRGRCRFYRS